ncbi:MAG: alpha/beta hydrolase, partial [Miltoncostaeaceae bacterium]
MPQITPGRVHEVGLNSYQLYVPDSHTEHSRVVVVVHGETQRDQDVPALAQRFIDRWRTFAENTSTVIVAPAFGQLDFGSHGDGFGGYRGLHGRVMGADEFVESILVQVGHITGVPTAGRRFFLYGHSAGGQFANRFLVRHPDRVIAAVLSAPGRYAFPDPDAHWHFGMGRLHHEAHWELAGETQALDIRPDPEGWVEAATRPVTVVVGDEDTAPQPCRPAHCEDGWGESATRIQIGRRWVERMNDLAERTGRRGRVGFRLIPGAGHDSAALTDACQDALLPHVTPAVPDLVGLSEHLAEDALDEVLLRARITRRLGDGPRGAVLAQRPAAGTPAVIGTTVTIDVSLGER